MLWITIPPPPTPPRPQGPELSSAADSQHVMQLGFVLEVWPTFCFITLLNPQSILIFIIIIVFFFSFGKVSAPPLPSWVFILLRLLRSSPPTCPANLSSKTELSSLRPSPTEQPVYFHLCHKTCAGFQNLYFLLFLLAQALAAGWVSAQMGSDPFRRGTRRPQKMPFQRN